jgi:hypothetical protein
LAQGVLAPRISKFLIIIFPLRLRFQGARDDLSLQALQTLCISIRPISIRVPNSPALSGNKFVRLALDITQRPAKMDCFLET